MDGLLNPATDFAAAIITIGAPLNEVQHPVNRFYWASTKSTSFEISKTTELPNPRHPHTVRSRKYLFSFGGADIKKAREPVVGCEPNLG